MVEEIRDAKWRDVVEGGGKSEILSLTHYPKDGGVRTLSISKATDGGYMFRLSYFNKAKNIREQQVMRLDEHELSYVVLKLLGVVLNGA